MVEGRQQLIENWKERKGRRLGAVAIVNIVDSAENPSDLQDSSVALRDTITLNKALLRRFISDDKWVPVCKKIKEYHEELKIITERLKNEGKKCTGCSLNPYRAKFATQLGEDFKDKDIILDTEVGAIKDILKTKLLQIGIKDGKIDVR